MDSSKTPDLRRTLDSALDTFSKSIGLEYEKASNGACRVSLELEKRHLNLAGSVHGGVLTTMLDCAMGGATVSTLKEKEWTATVQLNTQFLEKALKGKLAAEGKVVRRGKRIVFCEGKVVDDSGKVVAKGDGVWYVWEN